MTRLIQTNHSPFRSTEKIPWKRREVQVRSEKRDEDTYLSRRKWIVQGRSILLVNPRAAGKQRRLQGLLAPILLRIPWAGRSPYSELESLPIRQTWLGSVDPSTDGFQVPVELVIIEGA